MVACYALLLPRPTYTAEQLWLRFALLSLLESKGVEGKRAVVSPDRLLTTHTLAERTCAYYGYTYEALYP